jgi:hypothetical protein
VSAGSDLRAIDGRCSACGTWLSPERRGALRGCCVNVDCRLWLQWAPLRRDKRDQAAVTEAARAAGLK